MNYLPRVRVNAACRMLENTNHKCTAIALECGFYDHSHFSRMFRRFMGMPPQVYRQRHLSRPTPLKPVQKRVQIAPRRPRIQRGLNKVGASNA